MTSVMPKPDIEISIWIARPPEDIWKYIYDVSNETQWRDSVNSAQWVSDPPHGVGSTGLSVLEGIGDFPWKIVEWEEQRIMSWTATGGRFEGWHAGYRLAAEDAGSRVTIHWRMKPSGLMRILMPFMKGRIRRQLAAELEKLKALMEAQTPSSPPSRHT